MTDEFYKKIYVKLFADYYQSLLIKNHKIDVIDWE